VGCFRVNFTLPFAFICFHAHRFWYGCTMKILQLTPWPSSSQYYFLFYVVLELVWNLMAHGDAREGKWRGNWRMEWVASTLYTTSERGVSSITKADAHTSAASSQLNWRSRRFKWTRPFRRKRKSGFCTCAITFQTHYTEVKFSHQYRSFGTFIILCNNYIISLLIF